jgi:hypothetical protein
MPDLSVAEFVLSLVMPAERAAATVGDLTESSSGSLARWFVVMRTLLGTAFHQMRMEPMAVGRGALYVQVIIMAAGAAVGIAELVGITALESLETVRRMSLTSYIAAAEVLNTLFVAFFVGRYMLRRYGTRTIAVWGGAMIARLLLFGVMVSGLRTLPMDNGPFPTETFEISGLLELVGGSLQLLVGIAYEHGWMRKVSRA